MADNRPRGRKRNVTEGGSGVNLRGDGLGTGPVGSGTSGRGSSGSGSGQRNGRGMGGLPLIVLIIIAAAVLSEDCLEEAAAAAAVIPPQEITGMSMITIPPVPGTAISISITVPTAATDLSPPAGPMRTRPRLRLIRKWRPDRERNSRRSRAAETTL